MKEPSNAGGNNKRVFRIGRRLFLAGLVVSTTGCKNFVERAQSPDHQVLQLRDEKKKDSTKYVGDVCSIWGLNYAKVEGIGLAGGLNKTGSNPLPSGQRDYLVRELEIKADSKDVERMLASSTTEMVLLQGKLPPGIRKGENFDIEVRTLGKTDATSLENGMLTQTSMRPMEMLGRSVKKGHVNAMGKGRILVDALFESRSDQPNQLHGYILSGGVALEDRKLGLTVRTETFEPKTTTMISRAINGRYTAIDKTGRHGVAEPKTDRIIEIELPEVYRQNVGRFMQVIVNMAHTESPNDRIARMETLDGEMLDPAQAGITALRLEALGNDGIPSLKRALRHQDLEVKFFAAQALAYMGETDGVDHLKFVAKTEPAFRWHALKALAALNDVEAGVALADLMHVKSAETRYGAFQAIQTRSSQDPLVAGKWVGDFFLHRISSQTEPMLHFSRTRRPEVVVFGDTQTVSDTFLHVESGSTVRATGNGMVSITRYSIDGSEEKKVCSNRVGDLVETLAQSGYTYGDLLKMFRQAKNAGSLNSRLVVNAVPKLGRSYVPGQSAEEPPPEESDRYMTDASTELFNEGDGHESTAVADTNVEKPSKNKPVQAQQKTSSWGKMKDWFAGSNRE